MLRELEPGLLRVTFPLPMGIDHVHCYLSRGDGGWTVFDTGLGVPHVHDGWREALAELGEPVARIVVTHMHPDHIGGSGFLQELTGAPVLQGRDDHTQAVAVWNGGRPRGSNDRRLDGGHPGAEVPALPAPEREIVAYLRTHGMPDELLDAVQREADRVDGIVRLADVVELVDPGDRVDGWEVAHLPGHADGHIALFREGAMIAGDVLLAQITPNVGLWPESRPDPLGDFVASLHEIVRRAPRVAYAGHGRVIDDPAGRSVEILRHHEERLELVLAALREGPRSAYEVSLALFPDELAPEIRRFAVVESLAHLEHLVLQGAADRAVVQPVTKFGS